MHLLFFFHFITGVDFTGGGSMSKFVTPVV